MSLVRIEAVIEAPTLDTLRIKLSSWAVALAWTTVDWSGAQPRIERYRGAEYQVDSVRMVKLEALVPPDVADRATEAIERAVAAGTLGGYVRDERWGGDLVRALVPRSSRTEPPELPARH